jgi:hypothetical protein
MREKKKEAREAMARDEVYLKEERWNLHGLRSRCM